jgi:AcrR family transcriptional regulator
MGATTNTKDRIIEVAATLIDEHGESAVRIRELADTVGITQPSLYHHFANREAVLEAAHLHRFTTKQSFYVDAFLRDTAACMSANDFRKVVSEFFDFAHSDASRPIREARITVMAGALRRPSLMKAVDESLQGMSSKMGEAFVIAQNNKWIREDLNISAFIYWLLGELTVLVFAESTGHADLRPAISQLLRTSVFVNLGFSLDSDIAK